MTDTASAFHAMRQEGDSKTPCRPTAAARRAGSAEAGWAWQFSRRPRRSQRAAPSGVLGAWRRFNLLVTLPLGMIPPADAVVEPTAVMCVLVVDSSQTRAEAVSRLFQHHGGATCGGRCRGKRSACIAAPRQSPSTSSSCSTRQSDSMARFIRTIASDMNSRMRRRFVTAGHAPQGRIERGCRHQGACCACRSRGLANSSASGRRRRLKHAHAERAAEDASERHPRVAPASLNRRSPGGRHRTSARCWSKTTRSAGSWVSECCRNTAAT